MFQLLLAAALFVAPQSTAPPTAAPSAPASASPSPSPTPLPAFAAGYDVTLFALNTQGTWNADFSNALLNLTANAGNLHGNATVGEYNFPTVGFPIAQDSTANANTSVYSVIPVGLVQYSFNPHLSVAAGKFAALLGQESPFTFQNVNIERGIAWAMEPTISRGVQGSYTNGPWSLTLQYNDAYYSGHDRAFEGLIGWAPSASTNVQFAAIVPNADAGPNPTVSVGNKAEYDFMYTRQIGKLQLLPYVLLVDSPSSTKLAYARSESAWAGVLLATWAFNTPWSVALRYENAANSSSVSDNGANADLIGFGPGSSARTLTVTPTFRFGDGGVLRLEYSTISLSSFTSGLGFGPSGTGGSQDRIGFEFGVMR